MYENGNSLVVTPPPLIRPPSPLNAKPVSVTTKSNLQSSKSSHSSPSNQVISSSLSTVSNSVQSRSTAASAGKNDNSLNRFSSLEVQDTSDKSTVNIGLDLVHAKELPAKNSPVVPKLAVDVTLGSSRSKPKHPPTTLTNESLQTNLIILNTPPSPATTPSNDKGILYGQRQLSPQNHPETLLLNSRQGNTLTPTYLSSTTAGSLKPSPVTSPLAALKRHPGNKTPASDPVSPNIPAHHELDRRHSDSTNWPNLAVSTKVFTSVSTSSAASSINSTSTTEASDSQDSPLLQRPKLSQNGRELTIGKNNHTYQNTNLVGAGNFPNICLFINKILPQSVILSYILISDIKLISCSILIGKASAKLSSSIGVAIDSTSNPILAVNPLSCKS